MTAGGSDPPPCGLSYEGYLPLAWREVQAAEETELGKLNFANSEVLRTLLALETYSGELSDELPEADNQHVARLDFKLNLLLEMVGHLLAHQQVIPEAHALTLTPDTIRWRDTRAPNPDSLLRIEVYCGLRYPRPLIVYARVMEVAPQPEGCLVVAALQHLGETVREGLQRFIFVQHRRAVSQLRRRRGSHFESSPHHR
jgi:hypothetical protein